MRDLFEFHCTVAGGGCGGYVLVPLHTDEERDIILVCPNCRHEHTRGMKDGEITNRRHGNTQDSALVHRLEPTIAAWSKTSRLEALAPRGPLGDLWARFGRRAN